MTNTDSRAAYQLHVSRLEERLSADKAVQEAVGGEFVAVGKLEYHLLRSLGLEEGHQLVDVGCGSGRLACQLAHMETLGYLGCDVVPRLLQHARSLCGRDDWKFLETEGAEIPCSDNMADFVVFFSVFTHLLHEDTFRYFMETSRCLKPGGRMVFSFLEFRIPAHWYQFEASLRNTEPGKHLNQFIDRDGIALWAEKSGLEVVGIHDGDKGHILIPEEIRWENGCVMQGLGSLGQSVAILVKRP